MRNYFYFLHVPFFFFFLPNRKALLFGHTFICLKARKLLHQDCFDCYCNEINPFCYFTQKFFYNDLTVGMFVQTEFIIPSTCVLGRFILMTLYDAEGSRWDKKLLLNMVSLCPVQQQLNLTLSCKSKYR
jgi:hypothetical protein